MKVIKKLSSREQLIDNISEAESELRKYDRWFDTLKVGQTIYEILMFDYSPVIVISWDKNNGNVNCEYKVANKFILKAISKYALSKTSK